MAFLLLESGDYRLLEDGVLRRLLEGDGVVVPDIPTGKMILKDSLVLINDIDISNYVQSLGLSGEAEEMDVTPWGSDYRVWDQSWKTISLTLNLYQDFVTLDPTLQAAMDAGTASVSVRPVRDQSPVFTFRADIVAYSPLSGDAGAAAIAEAEFTGGALTRG